LKGRREGGQAGRIWAGRQAGRQERGHEGNQAGTRKKQACSKPEVNELRHLDKARTRLACASTVNTGAGKTF